MPHTWSKMMVHVIRPLCLVAGLLLSTLAIGDDFPSWLTERRIYGSNDLEPIEKAIGTPFYQAARALARVETFDDGVGFCTATHVGADLFLTNYHCFDYKPCSDLQFHLGYERDLDDPHQLVIRCLELLAKNSALDYALFRVQLTGTAPDPSKKTLPGAEFFGSGVVPGDVTPLPPAPAPPPAPPPPASAVTLDSFPIATLWTGAIQVDQSVVVPGFPGGRRKELDRSQGCKLRTVVPEVLEERRTITHTCDTEGGSSGSPLFDRTTAFVIALHWGGNSQFNMAIPMATVVTDLKKVLPVNVFSELQLAP